MNQPLRTPQPNDVYHRPDGVEVYTHHSQRGLVAVWERRFIRYVEQLVADRSTLRLLDIGTGPGWIPTRLAKTHPGWEVSGLDASPLMLERARRHAEESSATVHWIQADGTDTGLDPNSFDLVISHFAFHELDDPNASLAEVARILKPGGVFLLHDLQRPPRLLIPVLYAFHMLLTFSLAFTRQYVESLRAAYTRQELQDVLDASPLDGNVTALYGGSQLRLQATKTRT